MKSRTYMLRGYILAPRRGCWPTYFLGASPDDELTFHYSPAVRLSVRPFRANWPPSAAALRVRVILSLQNSLPYSFNSLIHREVRYYRKIQTCKCSRKTSSSKLTSIKLHFSIILVLQKMKTKRNSPRVSKEVII